MSPDLLKRKNAAGWVRSGPGEVSRAEALTLAIRGIEASVRATGVEHELAAANAAVAALSEMQRAAPAC